MKVYLKLRLIIIPFTIFILLFIFIECFLRIFYKNELDLYSIEPPIFMCDSVMGYKYIPNILFTLKEKKIKINNEGFIGDDFNIKKSHSTFRIVILGQSNVSGAINNSSYSNFVTTLQRRFDENDWNVEVLNCGIDGGHRTYEIYRSVKYKIVDFKPDLILCEYILPFKSFNYGREVYKGYVIEFSKDNNITKTMVKSLIDKIYRFEFLFSLIDISYTLKAVSQYYSNRSFSNFGYMLNLYMRKKITTGATDIYAKRKFWTIEKSVELSKSLMKELKEMNINWCFFNLTQDKKIVEECNSNQLPLLSFSTEYTPSMSIGSHRNEEGDKAVGTNFFHNIVKNKLIPEQYHLTKK